MVDIVLVKEGVSIALEQRYVDVHPAAVYPGYRLGHESGIHAVFLGYFLHGYPVDHYVVGHGQGVGVSEVDLMLAGSHFVMGIFDTDSHLLQRDNRLPAKLAGYVGRRHIEVSTPVQRDYLLLALEVEVLQLWPDVAGEALLRCP